MCGGLLGEAIGSIDKTANSINPMKQPMQWLTDNTIGKIPGIGKPAAQLYDYSNSHPLESLAAMGVAWGGASMLGGDAGAVGDAGASATSMGDAGAVADSGSVNMFADAVPGAGGDVGMSAVGAGGDASTAGIGGVGAGVDPAANMSSAGIGGSGSAGTTGSTSGGSFLQSLFGGGESGGGSGIEMNASTAKNGLGALQVLSSLYGMAQEQKLSKAASSQSISNAGLQAVQRSMAAQGYQGSGNMMTALSNYGANAYTSNLSQQQSSLNNTMSGLGLLTSGIGNMAGWGSTTPTKTGG